MNNVLSLAYLGDSVYELIIRSYLLNNGIVKPDKLQKEAVSYVSAKAQAKFMEKLLNNNFLNENEVNVYLRGRNHKSNHKPKNTDILTYKIATGFEAIFGYLYLDKNYDRINEIINYLLKGD